MGLNIKNPEVERLAAEVATALGITKTEAIRQALEEKTKILGIEGKLRKHEEFRKYMADIHKQYPQLRETKITKQDYDALYE